MKKLAYSLYMIVGAALLISGFATQEKGIGENNKAELERVADDYDKIGNLGFNGFCPLDYKVAFSNGEKDTVTSYDEGKFSSYERDAVYQGLVGSIYKNGDEYEVVVPEYDTWVTLSTINDMPLSAVIWHESFHAYQYTHFNISEDVSGKILSETELSEAVDSDSELVKLFTKETDLLYSAINSENAGEIKKITLEYLSVAKSRDKLLGEDEKASEGYYESLEGTAYYVESQVVRNENGEKAYEDNYLGNASEYAEGNAKYYRLGMLESMLLDKLDSNWKESYSFDRRLSQVIEDYMNK